MNLSTSTRLLAALMLCNGAAGAHAAPRAESVVQGLQVPIPNLDGTRFTSAVVTFPPGAMAAPHRHGAALVYAYVLSGTVRSQIGDEPVRVYREGEEWTEPPGAHHALTENPSHTRPARLLVIFIAPTGAPLKIPD